MASAVTASSGCSVRHNWFYSNSHFGRWPWEFLAWGYLHVKFGEGPVIGWCLTGSLNGMAKRFQFSEWMYILTLIMLNRNSTCFSTPSDRKELKKEALCGRVLVSWTQHIIGVRCIFVGWVDEWQMQGPEWARCLWPCLAVGFYVRWEAPWHLCCLWGGVEELSIHPCFSSYTPLPPNMA